MTDDPLTPRPRRRLPDWAPWALAALLLALGLSVWEPFPPGIWHDDGVYVLLGRSLAQGEGLRYVGVVGEPLAPKFPPAYPALLAAVWLAAPDFPDNVAVLAGLNLVILAAAAGLFARYLVRVVRLPPALALLVTALAWLSPPLWRVGLVTLSEPAFLLALVGALWAAARMEREEGWRPVALFVALATVAVYTRTLGIGVVAGGVAALLARRRARAAGVVVVGVGALLLPWLLWTQHAADALPAPLRDTLGPYGGWWLRQVADHPRGFAAFLVGNAEHLLRRILSLLLPGVVGRPVWIGLLLLPLLAVGMLRAGRRTVALPATLVFSLLVLLVWPFQNIRLVVPFHPLLVLGVVLGLHAALAGRRLRGAAGEPREGADTDERTERAVPGRLRWMALALGSAWIALVVGVSTYRLATGWPAQPYRIRSEALVAAARDVSSRTPPDAVVGAPELWSGIHLLTGRRVVPSARFRTLGESPSWGTPEEQFELWEASAVTHLVVEHGGRVHGEALDRLEATCPGAVQLLEMRPGQALVRLDWDAECRARLREER